MPTILVKELIVRAEVREPGQPSGQPTLNRDDLASLKQEIISECVEKVMEVINRQKER